jgi:hypothetical protein
MSGNNSRRRSITGQLELVKQSNKYSNLIAL